MTHNPAIDPAVIEQIRDIQPPGENLVAKIIALFLNESERLSQCLEQSIAEADWQAVSKHAHSLKSCSANVGALEVAALSHELEFACRENQNDQVPALYSRLRILLRSAVDELRTMDLSAG